MVAIHDNIEYYWIKFKSCRKLDKKQTKKKACKKVLTEKEHAQPNRTYLSPVDTKMLEREMMQVGGSEVASSSS